MLRIRAGKSLYWKTETKLKMKVRKSETNRKFNQMEPTINYTKFSPLTLSRFNLLDKNWQLALSLVVLVTLATRFYKVTEPDHVWWVHLNKSAKMIISN